MAFLLKRGVLVLSVVALAFAACGKKSKNGGGLVIPADIVFNEKALPELSAQDFAQAQLVARTVGQATGPESQIMIDGDESDGDRQNRQDDFNKLRPEVQQLVNTLKQVCQPNHKKTADELKGMPKAGQRVNTLTSNEAVGANCPAEMREQSQTQVVFTSFTESPLSMSANIGGSGSSSSKYKNPEHQRIMGASQLSLSFDVAGRLERSGDNNRSYMRMNANGQIAMIKNDLGLVALQMVMENLEQNQIEKTIRTFTFNAGGKSFVFSQYEEQHGTNMPSVRYFIGRRELSRDEVTAMGEFPFEVNGSRKGINGKPSVL